MVSHDLGMTELEDDEGLVDQAVAEDAFHFLRRSVVGSPQFHHEVRESSHGRISKKPSTQLFCSILHPKC